MWDEKHMMFDFSVIDKMVKMMFNRVTRQKEKKLP